MSIVMVRNLVKEYPTFRLNSVTFFLEAGKITGFIGRNGAGKTTTIKSMLNLVHPDSGEIIFFNKPLSEHEAEIKKQIGYSTGIVNWYPRKKIRDIVEVTKCFYDTWDEAAYHKYLRMFQLDENKTPRELSEGMKVKCNLLLVLSHKAEILILDEPTKGIDVGTKSEFYQMICAFAKQGLGIILISSELPEVLGLSDRIIVMRSRKIVGEINRETATEALVLSMSMID